MPRTGKSNINGKSKSKQCKRRRESELPSETDERLRTSSEYKRNRICSESPEDRRHRLANKHAASVLFMENETEEGRRDRLNTRLINRANAMKRTLRNGVTVEIDESCPIYKLDYQGLMSLICNHCTAKYFHAETTSGGHTSCCHKGKVQLPPLKPFPDIINQLLTGQHNMSKHFLENIRAYNSSLAFASFGAVIKNPSGRGPYVFRIHGQVYHRTSVSSTPNAGESPKFAQLYILDAEDAKSSRESCRQKYHLDADLLSILDQELRKTNPFAEAYKMLNEVEKEFANEQNCSNLVTMSICRSVKFDPRRYNAPSVNEVAVIFLNANGEPPFERDIRVHFRDSRPPKQISILNPNLDPMVYPILFPMGDIGWSPDLTHINSTTRVSQLQYYSYRFSIRNEFNPLLSAGKLTQQFIVDSFVRVEANRLNYIKTNQSNLRVEQYKGLYDYVHGQASENRPGIPVILPSTFIGSPRAMSQNYQDAMSIVSKFGKPDLFITMTCNPNWPEITENLNVWDSASNRPDLVSRVFAMKKKSLLKDITNGVLGCPVASIHVIEFQKRGLPHMHLLIILRYEDKPSTAEIIDRLVSAELPDPGTNPRLRELVLKHMVHGPCGKFNSSSPCMQDDICTKEFPKHFQLDTDANTNGYPLYRRRPARNIGPDCAKKGTMVDNSWIVPYNPFLLLKYNCHINTEICASIKGVKYLFKYVYKGHDCANVTVDASPEEGQFSNDEVQSYVDSRYISPPEAMWRLLENRMYDHSHSIIRLAIHLDREQPVYFHEGEEVDALMRNQRARTTLTDWFMLNVRDNNAKRFLYTEIPNNYVFNKQWNPRKMGGEKVIGRMYTVSPLEGERYFLRLLLLHVRGAESFENLRTVDGIEHVTFRQAAESLGLLADDSEWMKCMEEASLVKMPKQLRQLFANICIYCNPKDPLQLWESFKQSMIEDLVLKYDEATALDACLIDINDTLSTLQKGLADFNLPAPSGNFDQFFPHNVHLYVTEGVQMLASLLPEQRKVFDSIMTSVADKTHKNRLHYLDGVGGSGKTYLYNTLINVLRGQSKRVAAVASTGIASNLLVGGKTYFAEFGLPVPLLDTSVSRIKGSTSAGKLLIATELIIWDEVTMATHTALDVVDRCLRDLKKSDQPFGGVTVLLGGDFRQTLPVVRHANRVAIIEATIKFSKLWPRFTKHRLTKNKRAESDLEFSEWLLSMGDGNLETYANTDAIEIPSDFLEQESLVQSIFGSCISIEKVHELADRAILCPKNADVDDLNKDIENILEGMSTILLSIDSIDSDDAADIANFPVEFLNSITPAGLPHHVLEIKVGSVIMLLRNLNPKRNLCNGTRLIVRCIKKHVIQAEILMGNGKGTHVFLPRIELNPSDTDYPFRLKRRQFPVKLAWAMTINKSQGSTLSKVGVYLPEGVFTHGQLYVACSRVRCKEDLKIKILCNLKQGKLSESDKMYTPNCVFKEIFD